MNDREHNPDDALNVYVPGCWICLKCGFALSQQTLFVNSGEVGCTREQVTSLTGERCPNDDEPMRRETWHERADSNHRWGVDLMERIIAATKTESLPAALQALERLAVDAGTAAGHLDYLRAAMCESLGIPAESPDEDIIDYASERAGHIEHYEKMLKRVSKAIGYQDDGSEQWAIGVAEAVERSAGTAARVQEPKA